MPPIKPLPVIADKYVRNAATAGPSYTQGVQSPRRSWSQSTQAAAANYQAGVTAAIAAGRFASGVQRAGDGKWAQRSATLGANRYPEGVAAAAEAYAAGFGPYAQLIAGLTLPPRGARGAPANIERVRVIAAALHQRRTGAAGRQT